MKKIKLVLTLLGFVFGGAFGLFSGAGAGAGAGEVRQKCLVSPANEDLVEVEVNCSAKDQFLNDGFSFKTKTRTDGSRSNVWQVQREIREGSYAAESRLLKNPPLFPGACGLSGNLAERIYDCGLQVTGSQKGARNEICVLSGRGGRPLKIFNCELRNQIVFLGFSQVTSWRLVAHRPRVLEQDYESWFWYEEESAKVFSGFLPGQSRNFIERIPAMRTDCSEREKTGDPLLDLELPFRSATCGEIQSAYFVGGLKVITNFKDTLSKNPENSNKAWCVGQRSPVIFNTLERESLPDFNMDFIELPTICVAEVRLPSH